MSRGLWQIIENEEAEAKARTDTGLSLAAFVEATTNFKLDPWQLDLSSRLQELAFTHGRRILIHAPPQYGKPLYNMSMILMQDGSYKTLGEIVVGDYVIAHSGKPQKVLAVHEQGELECVRITTNAGRHTIAALDHPFLTPEGWIEAEKLEIGRSLACVSEPQCGGSSGRSDDEFELLGHFVGDGAVGPAGLSIHATVTSNDPAQAEQFMAAAKRLGFVCRIFKKQKTEALTYAFSGGVRQWLRGTGIAGQKSGFKEVPEWVFRGTQRQVALFLGAYFSCDGTVSPKGKDLHGGMRPDATVEFYSVSEMLLRGVQKLLLRVGVQCRVGKKNGRYRGNRHESWRLTFYNLDAVAQFAAQVPVPGKKGALLRSLRVRRKMFQQPLLADPVVSIERVGKKPCRCLTVEEDHTFTVDDLVVHNSIIVSQRFPAWMLARKPAHRVKLACHNITHATHFGKITRDLMQSRQYSELFPSTELRLPRVTSAEEFWTLGRSAQLDGQPSFKALGLATGFVGEGADLLIIDDPYASPEEAYSEAINSRVHRFWSDTAKPRLDERANVVVMFHRYHEYDLAGWLMEQEPERWEMIRYSAIADGDYTHPITGKVYTDPLDRLEGVKLSPRFSEDWLRDQAGNSFIWYAQFEGRPTARGGLFFKSEWFEIVKAVPAGCRRVRYWDKAGADEKKGDWTVGVLMAQSSRGIFYVEDVVRGQWTTHPRNQKIKQTAELDRQKYGFIRTYVEQPPGLGKESTDRVVKLLAGYPVQADPVRGDKVERAEPYKDQCEAGNVKLLAGEWNRNYLNEMAAFPAGRFDDQVDGSSGAFRKLTGVQAASFGKTSGT
ncbi:MAG: phage terminase large subunit [Acidobacteria bacterium]|nr:phage terminase large subunit [Acidobacteriota bacterium]